MTIRTSEHNWLRPALRLIVSASLSTGLLAAASTLAITSPADGSAASPGQNLAVTVTPSGSFTEVVVLGEGPIGFSKVLAAPPYQFTLAIPSRMSPGRYALTALGVTAGGSVNSLPISISVERTDAPVEFDVTPTTLSLPAGERTPLRVTSIYADGTKLDITHSAATTYSSDSIGVATVDSQGNVTAAGPGSAHIIVNNSLKIPVVVPAALSITPAFPFLYASQKNQFSVFQPGMAGVGVNWAINPQVGSINASGVYTAPPQITQQQIINIIATLKSDASKSIRAGVVLFPPVVVKIFPGAPSPLTAGQTQRFAQTVLNALDIDVDWSISPKRGSIDNTGLYTAPAVIKAQETVVVTATSIADSTKSVSVTVTLQP